MKESLRRYFDQQVDRVLAEAPPRLHELGHYHGLDEEDLEELGY